MDQEKPFRVVVVGAGAMGGVFGAYLTESGADTTLVDVDRTLVQVLDRDGLKLVESDGERSVPVRATTDPSDDGAVDAVLFFVKCQHTAAAAEAARPIVGDSTAVVSLQNGWGNADVLAGVYGSERVVVGVTYTSATVLERGIVKSAGPARTVLGPLADGSALADPVADALAHAGFAVERPDRVLNEVWKKLVLNAATLPTSALTGLTAGALAGSAEMRALVDAAAAEAVAAGVAQGFDVDLDERLESIHSVLDRAGSGKGSMLQDVEAGRPTEIDVISGAVIRAADEHGVDVPVTRALYALVTGHERARGLR